MSSINKAKSLEMIFMGPLFSSIVSHLDRFDKNGELYIESSDRSECNELYGEPGGERGQHA